MKKYLALLLVMALSLTALLGLAPMVSAEEETVTPSQDIAYFNVSIKVGARLLFAVPADGYTVNPDGTVDNLQLLVWEEGESDGSYSRKDAANNGTILVAQGKQEIAGRDFIIFSYNDLAASQMSESVYVRTLYTTADGFRSYSQVYEYSIAEFANNYLNRDGSQHVDLVEALVEYGYYAAIFDKKTSYSVDEVKALKRVTVEYTLNGYDLGTDVQLVKAGETTPLSAPIVTEANGVAPTWSVDGGVITTSEDATVSANFTNFATVTNNNTSADGKTNAIGSYISTAYSGNPESSLTGTAVAAPAGQSGTYKLNIGSINIGNNFTNSGAHAYALAKFTICGDETNQYVKFAHNGASSTTFSPAFVAKNSATGIGDTMSFTFSVDLMSGKDGTFPLTSFRIDKHGSIQGANVTGDAIGTKSPSILSLNENGTVTLEGKAAVEYNGIKTNVIAESISNTEFQNISVVVDFARGLYLGYLDGELKAVTSLNADLKGAALVEAIDALKNTRFQMSMYGGYQGGNWKGSKLTAAKAAVVELNGVETNVYDAESGTWNHAALEKYVDENYYFCYDDITVYYGALYNE